MSYDDIPVLYTGVNSLGNRILGSFIREDGGVQEYFHSIIDPATYASYVNQKINYLTALAKAKAIFVIQRHCDNVQQVIPVNFTDIPKEYLPLESSLCPEYEISPSLIYPISLAGGLANSHQAKPEKVSETQNQIAKFLRSPFKRLLKLLDVNAEVYLLAVNNQAHVEGSFKINYNVQVEERKLSLFHESEPYLRFLNSYILYCLNSLPEDATRLSENSTEHLTRFNGLWSEYEALIGIGRKNREVIKDGFIEDIIKVAEDLNIISDMVGDSYDQIIFSSLSGSEEHPLGVINEAYKDEIVIALAKIEEASGKTVIKDAEPQTYKIYIYDLNTDTRTGRALSPHPTEKDKFIKPSIRISGAEALTSTKYTESLHLDKMIEVKGRGTKVDNILKSLEIIYEE